MLMGGPPARLEVRDYKSTDPNVKPERDCAIQRIEGLTDVWWLEPSPLQYTQDCLDELWAFAPGRTDAKA